MADLDPALAALAEPLRERAVALLLESMAKAIDAGADVTPEPELRDGTGKIARSGPLSLPRRADLAVIRNGAARTLQIRGGTPPAGQPVVLATEAGFVAEVAPFRWDAATLSVFLRGGDPDWGPLRRWFLEWFQSRVSEVSPDLLGALHGIEGPQRRDRHWVFTIDFGSAPVACLNDLIRALAETGAVRMRLS
jgi:hypothetical protein